MVKSPRNGEKVLPIKKKIQKSILKKRFVKLVIQYEEASKNIDCKYNSCRIIISIGSMILPTLYTLALLYISFILPIYLMLTNIEGASLKLVDWGVMTFSLHFIITLFVFLRNPPS